MPPAGSAPGRGPDGFTASMVEAGLRAFLVPKSRLLKDSELKLDTALFTSGLFDSLTDREVIDLVAYLRTAEPVTK